MLIRYSHAKENNMHYVGTDLKKKIENREPLAGTLVTLSDPAVTEMIGSLG